MKNKENADAKKRRKDEAPVIKDPRFAGLHTDPRFQKLPKSRLRLPLDPRFQRMFTDKAFVDPFSMDKRGRPVKRGDKKEKKKHTLERYYRIEDEEDDDKEDEGERIKDNTGEEEASSSDDDEASESSPSDSSSSDEQEEEAVEEEEKVTTTDRETRRLAVVNMDWNCIKAMDLLVLFNSFLPKGGRITSVVVYPSQFGLEQMKMEETSGPTVFDSNQDEDDEVNVEKLRAYEKSKLRYYFAVVTCDSVSTASALYTACDGIEFERTSNILDLQFVPDEREFTVEPRDTASQVLDGYEAPDFQTAALQLSNVKLTWDDDEPVRSKSLRRKFDPDQIREMDFKAYLASDDEDEDEDSDTGENRREKLRSLLLDGAAEERDSKKKDVDMEITFPSGLEELNKKYLERNKKNKEETVWEAHLRKKKEKKLERKKSEKQEADDTPAAPTDEDGFDDPFFKSDGEHEPADNSDSDDEKVSRPRVKADNNERTKKREERELKKKEDERQQAELELLLLDENGGTGGLKGYNLKKGKKKSKYKSKDTDAKNEELLAKTDFTDPRFSALFTSHHFAIDPTDPQFKRSATKLRAIADMQQKRFQEPAPSEDPKQQQKKEMSELSTLVRSLKRKAAAT